MTSLERENTEHIALERLTELVMKSPRFTSVTPGDLPPCVASESGQEFLA